MSEEKPAILMIEDEGPIRDMVRFALTPAGFHVWEAATINAAQQILMQQLPALILLDWMLPGGSGLNYIKQLKTDLRTQAIPIIMLTAKAEENNKISGLESGADDYITKPFSPRELIARIKSVLRRTAAINLEQGIQVEQLYLDINQYRVVINHQPVELTPIEFRLLQFLLTHRGRVYSRQQLLEALYPHAEERELRTIDTQIQRLRNRLRPFGYDQWIKTVQGIGYQWLAKKA